MGTGFRIFLIGDDDSLKRLSMARFERLRRREPGERLLQYIGKSVRCAMVIVEVAGRKPIDINRIDYFMLSFDDDGRIDATHLEKQARLAIETLPSFTEKDPSRHVIDARSRFAKKRYEQEFKWKPTPELQAAIISAILDKEPA